MIIFYTKDIRGDQAYFDEEEARHCLQVLRKRSGEDIVFVDGLGSRYQGTIAEAGKKHMMAQITHRELGDDAPSHRLHIAISPNKNLDRFEWFLEKAVEIGISEITPLRCEHSERPRLRHDRLEKIILSAMKQSMRTWLPTLHEMVDFDQFIQQGATQKPCTRLICHCQSENLSHIKNNYLPPNDVTILIGPAGDFSLAEVALATEAGYVGAGLGKVRLRTETAGLVACHTIELLNQI